MSELGRETKLFEKVNELCATDLETFDPEIHVPYARKIVEEIDPNLGFSSENRMQVSFDDKRSEFGIEERRIGNYIVSKCETEVRLGRWFWSNVRTESRLEFDHYWDRDRRYLFERGYVLVSVNYLPESLELTSVVRHVVEPSYIKIGNLYLARSRSEGEFLWINDDL